MAIIQQCTEMTVLCSNEVQYIASSRNPEMVESNVRIKERKNKFIYSSLRLGFGLCHHFYKFITIFLHKSLLVKQK